MKRAHQFVLALLFLALFAPLATVQAQIPQLAASPDVSAQSVYVFDATEDVELLTLNSTERRAPASTVKIVTAMVVVDHADLDSEIIIDAADTVVEGESTMNLQAGDTLTVDQLLFGLLLPSGNDAARTLARHVGTLLLAGESGDPIDRFVQAMNDKTELAGLTESHFTTPSGLPESDEQYTTAFDLAHLGALAMGYDKIAEIVGQSSTTLTSVGPEARDYPLASTNLFLPDSVSPEFATKGVIGLKSGSTEDAGACLVLAKRERGGNLVIAVVLGSDISYDEAGMIAVDDRWQDMESVLNSVRKTFAWINPESENDVPGLVNEMAAWKVELRDDSGIIIPSEQKGTIRYQLELKPVGPSEAEAGRVLFFAGSEQIAERPLIFR